ncbi:MAG: hypothetical protein ABIB04_03580 [Patescibacteria group bacterium]
MAYSEEFLKEVAEAQDSFVWESPSWEERDRGKKWYIYMALIAVVLTIYAVITSNYLFAFIILLTAIILILAGNQEPRNVLVQIGNNGIVYNGKLFLYEQLSDFAIVYHPPQTKVIYIQPRNLVHSRMRIPLQNQDPMAIRAHLKNYLDEDLDLRDEHFSDIFARLLKL